MAVAKFSYGAWARRFFEIIKYNGGAINSFIKLVRGEDLRIGTLVGEDQFGNKYYESDRYFVGRHRWVSYTRNRFWDYDSSQIPPEWHRWIHCMTDDPPSKVPLQLPRFRMEHTENLSGSDKSYVPYSTTPKKIHEWVPPSKS